MLSAGMAARSSTSLPMLGGILAAAILAVVVLERPATFPVGLGWLAVAPCAALVLGGRVRAATVGAAVAFVAILDWAYTSHFSPAYAYTGLIDASPSPGAKLLVGALAAAPAAWLPLSARRPSTIVLWPLYLVGYVPTLMVPLYLKGDLGTVLPFEVGLVSSMVVLGLILRVRAPAIRLPHLSLGAFTRLVTGLAVLCILYIGAVFGVHALPSLSDVYTTRAEFGAAQAGAVGSGYVVPWAANAINPILMALGLAQRRLGLVALGLFGQLVIYSDTGYKAVLFSIALVPLVYFAISWAGRSFGLLTAIATPVILAGAVLSASRPADWSIALTTRVFATPGHVGWYYYDYFSTHAQYHLSHSVLSWLFSSPYAIDAPLLIGSVYFHQGTDANSSIWADAFANFGFGGIVAFTVVAGLVLLALDAVGRGRDARIAGPMLAIAGLSLGSTGLLTTVATQGLGVGGILLALMPPRTAR